MDNYIYLPSHQYWWVKPEWHLVKKYIVEFKQFISLKLCHSHENGNPEILDNNQKHWKTSDRVLNTGSPRSRG